MRMTDSHEFSRAALCAVLLLAATQVLHGQSPAAASDSSNKPPAAVRLAQAGVPGVTPSMDATGLIRLADQARQEAQYERSATILREVLADDPQNLAALSALAYTYEVIARDGRNSTDPAVKARAEEAIEAGVQAYLQLGATLRARNDLKTAEEAYIKVLNLRPSHPQGQLGLAQVQAASNREVNAIARYQDYLRNPAVQRDTDALFSANLELGQVLRRARMYGQSIATLQAAQRLNPESSAVFLELAKTYTDTAEYDRARTAAMTAIQKAARDPEPHSLLATIQLRTNDLDNAAVSARRAIELARAALQTQGGSLAMLRSLRDYYALYSQILQQQVARDPRNTAARIDLVRTMQEQSAVGHAISLHSALEVLRAAPAEARNDPRFLEASAETLAALGQTDEALRVARQLQQLQPGNVVAARILERAAAGTSASAPAAAATP